MFYRQETAQMTSPKSKHDYGVNKPYQILAVSAGYWSLREINFGLYFTICLEIYQNLGQTSANVMTHIYSKNNDNVLCGT